MSKQLNAVTGEWAGTWWPQTPEPADRQCKSLACTVVCNGASWQAVFKAECDQAYTFTVAMEGRPAGDVVLFKGTTDLGEQGGVFDWIGRAGDQEFVGFFTSSHYVGEFRLERKP
jgi:hypothetical protein